MLSVKILLFSISLYWPSGLGEVLASADTQVADPKALDVDTNTLLPAAPPTPTSWSVISSDHTWNERDAGKSFQVSS